jgi:FHA domain
MATCPAGHESASTDYCDTCGIRITGSVAAARPPGPAAPPDGTAPPGSAVPAAPAAESCPNCGTDRSGQFCEACGFDFSSGRTPSRPAPAPIHGAATISAPVIRRRGSRTQSSQPVSGQSLPSPPASSHPAPGPPGLGASGPPVPSPPALGPTASFPAGPGTPEVANWSAVVRSDRAYYDAVVAAGGADAATIKFPEYCPERRFRLTGTQMRIGRISPSRGFEPEIDLTGPPTDPGVSRLHAVLIPEADGTWAILDPGSENGTHVNEIEIVPDQRVRLHDGDRVFLGAWTVLTIHAT